MHTNERYNAQTYSRTAKLGDIKGGNYINIDKDGIMTFNGTAKISDSSSSVDVFQSLQVGSGTTNYMDISSAGLTSFYGTAGVTLEGTGKISFENYSGAASASGLLIGGGTSGTPLTTATADAKFVELRCQNTATSGDNRLAYMRFELGGAGSSGECVRAFTDLTAAVNTARGSHMSLQIDDTGYVTGFGAGIDAQLFVGDAAVAAGGTYAALNVEIYSAGSSSSIAAVTESSFIRINNGGDATGAGVVDDNAVLFDLNGFTSGAAKLWYDNQGGAPANVEEWIKIRTPAGIRYLAVYNAVV